MTLTLDKTFVDRARKFFGVSDNYNGDIDFNVYARFAMQEYTRGRADGLEEAANRIATTPNWLAETAIQELREQAAKLREAQ